jgi:hypothetical protein
LTTRYLSSIMLMENFRARCNSSIGGKVREQYA